MSIAVPLPELPDQVGRFGLRGFLVTVSDDGRAHPASEMSYWRSTVNRWPRPRHSRTRSTSTGREYRFD